MAEIHTHKPRRAGEATHCGLLGEKWRFESLKLRKALGRVWSALSQAVFRITCLSIASHSPDCKVTQSHILIQFSGKHELLSGVTFIFLYPAASECSLSCRIHYFGMNISTLESYFDMLICCWWKYASGRVYTVFGGHWPRVNSSICNVY